MTTRFFILVALAIAVLGLVWPGMSEAASFPPAFVVADVPVDAATSAEAPARDTARHQGESKAIRRLLERLTAPKDWPRLPGLGQQTISSLLVDYEVLEEHSTAQRYVASYLFRFSPKGIRQLLRDSGVAFSEVPSKPVVVIPVLKLADPAAQPLDPDPWRDAWMKIPTSFGLVPWVVPEPDSQVAALADPTLQPPKPQDLQSLSQRYDGGDIVLATANLSSSGTHLDITVTRFVPDGPAQTDMTSVDGPKTGPALWHSAVAAAVIQLENRWKSLTLPTGPTVLNAINVVVPVAGASDWGAIRDRLGRVGVVRTAAVNVMTRHELRLTLNVAVDPATLKTALAQQDLMLNTDGPVNTLAIRSTTASALSSLSK